MIGAATEIAEFCPIGSWNRSYASGTCNIYKTLYTSVRTCPNANATFAARDMGQCL